MSAPVSGPADLAGETAVVTGAAGGLGRAICEALAREGADVVASDVDEDRLDATAGAVEDQGQECLAVVADVTDEATVADLRERAESFAGGVDVLVNAHGLVVTRADLPGESVEDWRLTLDVNLTGVYLVTKAFFDGMVERGSGKIVSIGSVAGQTGRPRPATSYGASKGGVHAFTRTLAGQAAPHGVYVNAIAPGPVRTPLTDMGEGIPVEDQPLGRIGEPEDVAEAVLFLASDQSNWITGTVLDVNGGEFLH